MPPRAVLLGLIAFAAGCGPGGGALEAGFGERGMNPAQFVRPRAQAADPHGAPRQELFVVDFSGRIQVFDLEGKHLRTWRTPSIANGRPAAVALSPTGEVVIADSHYQRVLIYTRDGELLRDIHGGDKGGPPPFGYVSGLAVAPDGTLFVAEFGDRTNIHRYTLEGNYLGSFGSHGTEPGQFARPRGLAMTPAGDLVVADSCNHRLQVLNREGQVKQIIGRLGTEAGELGYPYSVAVAADGSIYTVEFGNHRVQKFSPEGQSLGMWGKPGRGPGLLHSPWGICIDGQGTVWVADTENHRLLRLKH